MAGSSVEPRNAPARCASIGDDTTATANTPTPRERRDLARIGLPDPTIDPQVRLTPDTTYVLHASRVLTSLRRTPARSAPAPSSLPVWGAPAGPLRSRCRPRLVA